MKRTTKVGTYVSREFEILKQLEGCDNCVQMLTIFYTKNEEGRLAQNIVFEYCSDNLESMVCNKEKNKDFFTMAEVRDFMRQIL